MWSVRPSGQLLQPQLYPLGGQPLDTRTIAVKEIVRKRPSGLAVLQSLNQIQDALMILLQHGYIRCGSGFRHEIDRQMPTPRPASEGRMPRVHIRKEYISGLRFKRKTGNIGARKTKLRPRFERFVQGGAMRTGDYAQTACLFCQRIKIQTIPSSADSPTACHLDANPYHQRRGCLRNRAT